MFTKLAQSRLFGFGLALQTRPTVSYGADGHPQRRFIANSHRARRPALVCRWRKAPSTGALECVWQTVEQPTADEAGPKRLTPLMQRQRQADACASQKPPLLRAA